MTPLLGIWFSYNQKEMTKLNFENKLASIEKTLQIWSSRILSLKGKVSIIKTLVIPKIVYALSLTFCPTKILEKLDEILFSFLWDNKIPKIKCETIIANYCDGGLKMTDVFLVHESAKIRLLKRILKSDNMKWTKLTWYLLNIEKHLINHKTTAYYTGKSSLPVINQAGQIKAALKRFYTGTNQGYKPKPLMYFRES